MRHTPGSVKQQQRLDATVAAIAATPWQYDYFHALRLIDAQQPHRPRLGTAAKPKDEPVRLGQAAELSFAPSTLHAAWVGGIEGQGSTKPRIEVRFFGLFGPNGPLPLHLTEYARERALHHGDHTFSRFADLFHHRLLLLLYRAWAQAQPTASLDRPAEDRFAAYTGSLIGIGIPELQGRDGVHDHVKLHFAGLQARQVRSAEGLAALLSGWLGRPVNVRQFEGAWLPLQPQERTRIGRSRSRQKLAQCLGHGAVLGSTVWDRQHQFSLQVGPLDHSAFTALLPGGAALPAMVALVEHYVGYEFGWHLNLSLEAAEVRPARLGRHGRLGWDSWLPRPATPGPAQVRLAPSEALAALTRRHRRYTAAAQAPNTTAAQ